MFLHRSYTLACLSCLLVLGGGVYFEHALGLSPCALCSIQRVIVGLLALLCFVRAFHVPLHRWVSCIYSTILFCLLTFGGSLAGYHLWLQHQPAERFKQCVPGINAWSQGHWWEFLQRWMEHHPGCANLDAFFLGLSIPTWLLLFYIVGFCIALVPIFLTSALFRRN